MAAPNLNAYSAAYNIVFGFNNNLDQFCTRLKSFLFATSSCCFAIARAAKFF